MSDTLFTLILWLAPCVAAVPAAKGLVHVFQLSSYQFGGYLAALKRRWRQEMLPGLLLAVGSFALCAGADYASRAGSPWLMLVAALLTLALGIALGLLFHRGHKSIKRLHYTSRVKRLFAVLAVVMVALGLGLRAVAPIMGLSCVLPLFLPLWLALAALLVFPLEHFVKKLFERDAMRQLDAQEGLIRIGITGSYGKTSVKFFLAALLRQRYSVLATRSSFNTPMGITRSVREDLEPAHRVFIAEMGARHRHDIRQLCRLVRPQIGVLTAVGPQHLETFGSLERVRDTKYDLIRALPKDGYAVFFNDGGICLELYQQTALPKAIVGKPEDDLWAEDLQLDFEGSRFTLCFKDGTRLKCQTQLCGQHNINNLLLAAAVARRLGLTDAQLQHGIAQAEPVQARLKPEKQPDGSVLINNGFNTNPESSRAALAVLAGYDGRKVVITPGYVELGAQQAEYHRQMGEHIAAVADLVLLVGPKRTLPIKQGLENAGFNAENIHTFVSLQEAQSWMDSHTLPGDIILYENDLPDQYSEALA
ncbi:MAG: UDP-N-acetylmuramoyl-tripeptide--D-alanyl-D-alanine ligase [Clostridiales bacterium]|nr:UDP-N-acetylmuramoyl-tripeptide--D-alanyl-D-alanine ligase [Clostridiales bacterium]